MTSMRGAEISFPMFGEGFIINPPDQFSLFGLSFYFYGVIIALGFLLAVLYAMKRGNSFGITQDNVLDVLIFALPAGIVGARLYYVVFNFAMYKNDFAGVFRLWEGGLAVYGGIAAGALTAAAVCKIKKIHAGAFLDITAFGFLIGQSVGRWGNFFNREAFGSVTDLFCRMGLAVPGTEPVYVHPTFLYESLWNALGLLLLHLFSKSGRRQYDGQIFIMYVAWYGLGRVFIEGLRADSLYLFGSGIRVSQLLAGLSLLAALGALFINGREKHDPQNLFVNKKDA
ncbi:MAG: prolipoprotein diacylglyceryl transferase [Oscillospiraceae bacterium]|nr:prolipoprotein diacylglyceryl transferase [Oscillospiraceae bacterium]